MLMGMVSVVFADVAKYDWTGVVALDAHDFLRKSGHFVISIKEGLVWLLNFHTDLVLIPKT